MRSADERPCELLAWDTEFWEAPIGRVQGDILSPDRVARVDAWASDQGVACLYFLARSDDNDTVWLAEEAGFRLVDVRVTMTHVRGTPSPFATDVRRLEVRSWRDSDMSDLRRLALESYPISRFYYDGHFPREKCAELYATWIERSCGGEADAVLVAAIDGAVAGYISCHLPGEDGRGTFGLIAVDDALRRLGVGDALLREGIAWLEQRGAERISIATQGRNIGTQRFVQRHGFLTEDLQLWFHKWYDAGAASHDRVRRLV